MDMVGSLKGENLRWGEWQQNFGLSVFIDGNNIAVGTENNAVYVFKRSGNNWMEQAKITASDGAPSGC